MTVVTRVKVDKNDPAFATPTKPIGSFIEPEEVAAIKEANPDWILVEDSGRGFRRVVASPKPLEIAPERTETVKGPRFGVSGQLRRCGHRGLLYPRA